VRVAAKLISPVVEHDFAAGFDWTIEALKQPTDSPRNHNESRFQSSNGENATKTTTTKSRHTLEHVAAEMEIAKGVAYLKKREFARAIEVFRAFEKREQTLLDQAATNLSFLYFLEGDYKAAEKHAEFAVKADRYNARALVNRANCLFVRGELEAAKEVYLEAIGVEADCVEAIYNLGLVNKRLDNPGDALQAFRKLHRIVPKSVTVIYQIANLFEMLNDHSSAAEWFKILHGAVPTDPKVLARLGNIFSNEDDHTQAFHNYLDSYRHMPTNMEVITWLGVWYVKSELYEPAIQYFERAAEIEPQEVKWRLMVASCYRRMGAYQKALELYREIHHTDSDNIECLRYLCTITKDLGDKSHEEYAKKLRKAERATESEASQFHRDDVPSYQPEPEYHGRGNHADEGNASQLN
jgi:intraflagellar transport protein 88